MPTWRTKHNNRYRHVEPLEMPPLLLPRGYRAIADAAEISHVDFQQAPVDPRLSSGRLRCC
jgi:hypothetical protein